MNSLRSTRASYFAAFLLGGLIAILLARPGHAAELFQLDRLGVVKFTAVGETQLLRQTGVLHVGGTTQWRPGFTITRPANLLASTLNRPLVARTAWHAYYSLGAMALAGFALQDGVVIHRVADEEYYAVAPDAENTPINGRVVNISTRAVLRFGLDEVIAGFVVEDRPRAVLIRVIGPSLAQFGVPQVAPDTFLSLKRNGQTIAENDNWSDQPNADLVRAAMARVGAFPLAEGSRDSAQVVILAPGAYTAHASAAAPNFNPGAVMVEVYTLSETDVFLPYEN